jgi:hypothetical protein
MGRTIAAALTAIAVLIGGGKVSFAPPDAPPRTAPVPSPTPGDASRSANLEVSAPAIATAPQPEVEEAAPLPVPFPPELDLGRDAPAIEGAITRRCGKMRFEALHDAARFSTTQDEAVLLVSLETLSGQARIVDSVVHSRGRARPALVACAQWALRGQVVAAPGVEPGRTLKVPVAIGVGAPR